MLCHVQGYQELPLFARLYQAWTDGNIKQAGDWNNRVIALRETAELRAEERNTGALLEVMDRDARRILGARPFVFTNLKTGAGVDFVESFIHDAGLLDRIPV